MTTTILLAVLIVLGLINIWIALKNELSGFASGTKHRSFR
jgi:hypothetical protein